MPKMAMMPLPLPLTASAPLTRLTYLPKVVDKVKAEHPDNLCAKYLEQDYYASLTGADRDTFYKCVRTGMDNPDSGMGCYAMTPGGEGPSLRTGGDQIPLSPRLRSMPPSPATVQLKWSRRPRCCSCGRLDQVQALLQQGHR